MPDNNALIVNPVLIPAVNARGQRVKLRNKVRKEIKLLGAVWDKDEKAWRAPGLFADEIRKCIHDAIPEVEPIDLMVKVAGAAVDTASSALSEAEANYAEVCVQVVNQKLGTKFRAYRLTLGGHECNDSPTGYCAYDDEKDVGHDGCLFCREPKDRG